jgi:hypothetical protein
MSGIDWSEAPEGAQGYMPQDNLWIAGWWKEEGGSRYFWSQYEGVRGGWKKSFANPFDLPEFIPRPSPAWNGEGLPPVGTACLDSSGCEVVIVAHHANGKHAIFAESMHAGLLYYGAAGDFRQIRTPEQIAADEREAAVKHMLDSVSSWVHKGGICNAETFATMLYDAGYRKLDLPSDA